MRYTVTMHGRRYGVEAETKSEAMSKVETYFKVFYGYPNAKASSVIESNRVKPDTVVTIK